MHNPEVKLQVKQSTREVEINMKLGALSTIIR